MSLITDIHIPDKNNCSFILNNIDKSLVNAFRRTIISGIPTYKFRTEPYEKCDVKVIKNTCALHNEFLIHRIGMIPVYIEDIEDFDPSKYTFKINIKNDTQSVINVTTNDFKVYQIDEIGEEKEVDSSLFFKPDPITKEYIVITKLKPDQFGSESGEEVEFEAKLTIGTGEENAGYSPVSKAVFYNSIDEKEVKSEIKRIIAEKEKENDTKLDKIERQKIQKNFENFEAYRHFCKNNKGEPNKFNFEIESIGILTVEQIMNKAIDLIEKNINYFNLALTNENEDIEIINSPTVMDGVDIIVKGQGHTLGNLVQSYLFTNFVEGEESLKFVGYKIPHPLKKELVFRIQISSEGVDFEEKKQIIKDIIQTNTEKLNEILGTIRKQWNGAGTSHTKTISLPTKSSSQSSNSSEKVVIIKKKKSSSQ
jgi:DNA-directed RNA polymerase II subunit RPB3